MSRCPRTLVVKGKLEKTMTRNSRRAEESKAADEESKQKRDTKGRMKVRLKRVKK